MGMEVDRLEIIVEAEAKKASAELDKLIGKLTQVGTAMKGATGLKLNGASGVSSTTNSLSKYTSATSKAINGTRSLTAQISRLAFAFYSIKRVIGGIGSAIKSSMDFTETINLFQTSFKKIGMEEAESMGMEWGSSSADAFAKGYIERAQNFNNLLTDSLGLDPNTMMNYQAVFAQMSNSMGLVTDSAMNISETFTMLGNDIASLWNIDTKSAMQKLQSGLAGQIRPLRQLGIDISQTSLQMTAHNHGIDDSVIKMSQAAKVQLRWLSVMEQAEVAFGDMAKTIDSPANQLRILKQQWDLLSRSIGNVFLPVIQTILPFVNAVVIALRNMINTLATAMGYELPDYKDSNIYTDATTDIDGMTDGIEDATTANEKLKKSMYSGDELNILSAGSSSGSGGVDSGSGYGVLDDAIQQKTESYMKKFNEELEKMQNKSKLMAENIQAFFGTIAEKVKPTTDALKNLWDAVAPLSVSIGKGFVDFVGNLEGYGEDALNGWIPSGINGIADALSKIDPSSAEKIGKGLGSVALAFGGFKIIGGLVSFMQGIGGGLASIISPLSGLIALNPVGFVVVFNDLVEGISEATYAMLPKWAKDLYEGFWKIVTNIFTSTFNFDYSVKIVKKMIASFKEAFSGNNDSWLSIGGNIIKGILLGIYSAFSFITEPIIDFFSTLIKNICTVFGINSPSEEMKPYGEYIMQGLIQGIVDGWDNKWSEFSGWLATLDNKIAKAFGSLVNNFVTKGGQIITGIKNGWNDGWESFKIWLSKIPDRIASGIGSLFDIGQGLIDGLIKGFTSKDMPKIEFYGGVSSDGRNHSSSGGSFATGGYPTPGQLFVANEPGNPELIGNVGGRTAVMNNNQIVEAVSQGVAIAVASVMGGQSSGGQIIHSILKLGEDVVYEAYENAKRSNGMRFNPTTA